MPLKHLVPPTGGKMWFFWRSWNFIFNGNKIITSSGGGVLASDNEDYVKRAKYLSTQSREPVLHYEHKEMVIIIA